MAQAQTPEQIKAKIRKLHADISQRKERINNLKTKPDIVEKSMDDIIKDVLGNVSKVPVKSFRATSTPLAISKGQKIHIYPKEEGFEKHVQTDDIEFEQLGSPRKQSTLLMDDLGAEDELKKLGKMKAQSKWSKAGRLIGRNLKSLAMQASCQDDDVAPSPMSGSKPTREGALREMSAEEKERVLVDSRFLGFFDRASKLVERCLSQERDPLQDFSGDMSDAAAGAGGEEKLIEAHAFTDEKYTVMRPITDVRFSPKFPELMLASYAQMENPSLQDPDGLVLVWSLGLKSRPEHVFTSNSPVLTALFDKFNPALYVGGTYSGSVLLWDARVKRSPVQRTLLSAKGHAHPVYAMQQVGTQNATNLITASTDGRLCIWSLNMLSTPQEHVELKKTSRDLAVTSLSFPDEETNMLYVGSEDGSVCQALVHGTKSAPVTDSLDGHEGPVTAVNFHPQPEGGGSMYSSLLLSCSVDWSIKLWHTKKSSHTILHFDGMYEDYVCDVKWHPVFPSIFCSVDAEGTVSFWNLNKDLEAPQFRTEPRKIAYNRCDWSNDGHHFATGDVEGNLQLWTCDKSFWYPKADDFSTFEARIESLEPIVTDTKDVYGASRQRH
eukprot:GEMP01015402.1.p1 GENE.GEMP01015402.1~~GEMP01015402.1.p1  ORF type:complete len:608 (+),score=81.14 GEMP01015402.1:86-1909(+)